MNMRPLILLLFLSIQAAAQSPGGISGNLRGWYDASTGITLTGGAVSQWNDRSGNGFNATQGTSGSRPANTAQINYNTAIDFDGANDFLNISDLVATGTTGLTAFAVAQQSSTGGDTWGCVLLGQTNSSSWTGGGYGLTALSSGNTDFGFWVTAWNTNFVSYATTLSSPALMTGSWNGTTANNVQYFQNSTSRGTDAYTPGTVGDGGNSYIGSGVGSGTEFCFNGNIAEIAVYNTGLSSANVNRVESYLALKYGIPLSTNYVNSAGTTIFTTSSPYNDDIFGIGRDDGSGLIQKQSHPNDDSVRVFIGTLAASNTANTGAFSANHQYLMIGGNTGKLSATSSEMPSGVNTRIEREWKVTNTGFNSTFSFAMKLSAAGAPGSVNTAHLRLLVDDDGNFTNATVVNSGISFSYSNPVITVSGIDNTLIPANSTRYITIASAVASTPLPIELTDFRAWLCNQDVCLEWSTATETNNDYFELSRSRDALNWETVGKVNGNHTSFQKHDYSLVDEHPLPGISYYRLKQVDMDGTEETAPIIFVENDVVPAGPALYPNPADLKVFTGDRNGQFTYRLLDPRGNDHSSVIREGVTDRQHCLYLDALPDGTYTLLTLGQYSEILSARRLLVLHN